MSWVLSSSIPFRRHISSGRKPPYIETCRQADSRSRRIGGDLVIDFGGGNVLPGMTANAEIETAAGATLTIDGSITGSGNTSKYPAANYYRIMRKNDIGVTTFSEVLMVMLDLLPEDAIRISPNPVTQNYLYIENQLVMDKDMYISMFAADGTFIRSIKIPENTTQTQEIDLSYLSSGIYLLTYTYKDGSAKTVKIAKF